MSNYRWYKEEGSFKRNRSAYYIVGDSHRFEMFGAEFRYEV